MRASPSRCPLSENGQKQKTGTGEQGQRPAAEPVSEQHDQTDDGDPGQGGTIWTAEEPLPSRNPVESRLSRQV
jgi:hypothetical protein